MRDLAKHLRRMAMTAVAIGAVAAYAPAWAAGGAQNTAADTSGGLIHYNSNNRQFWLHPPANWYMGDQTNAQKGEDVALTVGPATGISGAKLQANLKKIKLPPGFHISVYADHVLSARQMALGDKGTLFVGSFSLGVVYAVTDHNGRKEVKTILKGLKMPTGIAFRDGTLYVADIDRILAYPDAEDHLGDMPKPTVVYADMPPYLPHGWKYIAFDKQGWIYMAFGPPCNECMPPTSNAQIRRINPKNGEAYIVALGVRNSVGGAVDPRTGDYWFSMNERDWLGDNSPQDTVSHISRLGENFGYPFCHNGNIPDPTYNLGIDCSQFTPPTYLLGPHVAPLGMKFYTGSQFPASYKDNIFLAEHGSWNRRDYLGGRIVRLIVSPDGSQVQQKVFATGWIQGTATYLGRPSDVIVAKDGSLLVADDYAGAIYQISYNKGHDSANASK
ncbi:MAG: PQQ-dependent sugar dehydrogenase [Bradyrhizobium sp.]